MSPYSRFDREFHDLHRTGPRQRRAIEVEVEVVDEADRPRVQPPQDFWRTMAWGWIAFLILLAVICLLFILIGGVGFLIAFLGGVLASNLEPITQAFVNLG